MNKAYVGMTLMKFEELGIEVDGVPLNIQPKNLIGFLPVFASLEVAKEAGWADALPVNIGKEE